MKVHVVLKEKALDKVAAKSEASLARYLRGMKIKNVDLKRMLRHGIISGDIDDSAQVALIEKKRDVEAVELDQVKRAI